MIETSYDRLSAYSDLYQHFEAGLGCDALFCSSDVVAISAISVLNDLKISVPDEVAVVGYDDIMFSSYCSPSLTTVHQNIAKCGSILVDRVLRLAAGEDVSSVTLPTELVVRQSCGTRTRP